MTDAAQCATAPTPTHSPLVSRTPIGPRPANPSRQRYATTVACTCGWDFGIVTTVAPIVGGGQRLALETHRRHVCDSEPGRAES